MADLSGDLNAFLNTPASGGASPPPASPSASPRLAGDLDSFLNKGSATAAPLATPAPAKPSALPQAGDEKPSLARQFFLPASMQPRGTGFGEEVMAGAGELAYGAGSAALDAAGNIPGVGDKMQGASTGMKNEAMHLHELGKGSLGEGIGYYGPIAALAPEIGGVMGTGAITGVGGNVLDATKSDAERYGLVTNAVTGAVDALGGKFLGAPLANRLPAATAGLKSIVGNLPGQISERGVKGGLKAAGSDAMSQSWEGTKKMMLDAAHAVSAPGRAASAVDYLQKVFSKQGAGGKTAEEMKDITAKGMKYGINLPLYAVSDNEKFTNFMRLFKSGSAASPMVNARMKNLREVQVPEALHTFVKGLAKDPNLTPMQAAQNLKTMGNVVYGNAKEALKKEAEPHFDAMRTESPLPTTTYDRLMSRPEVKEAVDYVVDKFGTTTKGYKGLKELVVTPPAVTEPPALPKLPQSARGTKEYTDAWAKYKADMDAFREGATRAAVPSYNNKAILNEARKRLGEMSGKASRAGDAQESKYLNSLKQEITEELREHSSNFVKGMEKYGDEDAGGKVRQLEGSVEEVMRDIASDKADNAMATLSKYDPSVIARVRDLYANSGLPAARDTWDNAAAGWLQGELNSVSDRNPFNFAERVGGSPKKREVLKAMFPDSHQGMEELFDVVKVAQEGLNKMGFSVTTPLSHASNELADEMGGVAGKVIQGATDKTAFPRMVMQGISKAYNKALEQNPRFVQDLAHLLSSEEGVALLGQLKKAPGEYKPSVAMSILDRVGAVGAPAYLNHAWRNTMGGTQ